MVIDGNNFFDLYGNVLEWSSDWGESRFDGDSSFVLNDMDEKKWGVGTVNPEGAEFSKSGRTRVMRGGYKKNFERSWGDPVGGGYWYGFRLVRTLK